MRFGEQILNKAEKKFGGLALPGILKWIVGFQILGLILNIVTEYSFMEAAYFDRDRIFAGEVWRLITWLFLPFSTGRAVILMLIFLLFMFFINDVIEQNIGTFRLNAFVVSTIVFFTAAGLVPTPANSFEYGLVMQIGFIAAMIIAAACLVPDYTIMLWMIIPVKMMWIGWMKAAFLVFYIFKSSTSGWIAILIAVGLIPLFLGMLLPLIAGFRRSAEASARRAKFQRDTGADDDEAFHTCHNCGINDQKDPHMEFRVSSDDGHEYCLPCRERKQAK